MIKHCTLLFRSLGLVGAAAMLGPALLQTAMAQTPANIVVPQQADHYIVTFARGTTAQVRARAARRAGVKPLVDLAIINSVAIRVPDASVLAALQANPAVARVVRDRQVLAFQGRFAPGASSLPGISVPGNSTASDTTEVVPAGVKRVGEPTSGEEGAGVGIMIGDTGIDWTHSDLKVSSDRFDAYGGTCMDRNGHGTHVAGTAAALKNGIDVVGVAPGATLYCGKVLGDNGSGTDSSIISLLEWVVNKNSAGANPQIRVINLSLGRDKQDGDMDGPLREAIQTVYKSGVTIVVAAGNDANSEVKSQVPAGFPEVIAVGSTTAEDGNTSKCPTYDGKISADTASYFTTDGAYDSSTGIGVTISAPGGTRENVDAFCRISCEGILSTAIGGGTTNTIAGSAACGTSMASPHVAGLVARLIAGGVSGPENVRSRLRTDGDRQGTAPLDSPSAAYTYDGEREGVAISNSDVAVTPLPLRAADAMVWRDLAASSDKARLCREGGVRLELRTYNVCG